MRCPLFIIALIALPCSALAAEVNDYAGATSTRDVWARDMGLAGYDEEHLKCMAQAVLPVSPIDADAAAEQLAASPSDDTLEAFEDARDAFVAEYRKQKGKHPYEIANMICDHGYN